MTVTHTNPAVAQLVTTARAARPDATVSIAAGAFNSPTTVAAGAGVRSGQPGHDDRQRIVARIDLVRTESVTVTAPGITLFSLPTTCRFGPPDWPLHRTPRGLGSHRRDDADSEQQSGRAPRVSECNDCRTEFIDVGVAANSTDVSYYMHGMEGSTGSATITATATGFTSGTGTGNVVTSGLQIEGRLYLRLCHGD